LSFIEAAEFPSHEATCTTVDHSTGTILGTCATTLLPSLSMNRRHWKMYHAPANGDASHLRRVYNPERVHFEVLRDVIEKKGRP
jgi:hypothetical protein